MTTPKRRRAAAETETERLRAELADARLEAWALREALRTSLEAAARDVTPSERKILVKARAEFAPRAGKRAA